MTMAQTFSEPINSNDQSLERVLGAGLPVALVFENGSSALDDTLSRIARENAGQLLVVKIKAGDNPQSARRFQVGALPAVVTVKGGQPLSQAAPASPAEVEQHVAYLLGKGPRPAAPAHGAPAGRAAAGADGGGQPLVVGEATFEEQVERSPVPVLVDFWAPWCGPCQTIAPVIEKLGSDLAGQLKVVRINTDDNPGIGERFGIRGIPTLLFYSGGHEWDRLPGAPPGSVLRKWVESNLAKRGMAGGDHPA